MTAEMEVDESPRPSIIINIKRKLSNLVQVEVEPVGKWFHNHQISRGKVHHHSAGGGNVSDEEPSEEDDDDVPDVEIEDDIRFLRSLDPADWKNQDHYAVLGLKKYRYKASDDDIKKAYRSMVLKHHPDKRKGAGEEIREDDDYFTCITKAYEIIGVPSKRRAYDSVDSEFDNEIPTPNAVKKKDFFEVLDLFLKGMQGGPQGSMSLLWGSRTIAKKRVIFFSPVVLSETGFYNFWFDFDSWREFSSWMKGEGKGTNREERRWIEKQNKAERARRKKEETARIRRLVDMCYNADPRIIKFKEEEKERKLAIKKAKQDSIRQRIEEEEKLKKAEEERLRLEREAEEAQLKAKMEAEKKEREAIKKALKKERKTLRVICKDHNYYTEDDSERVQLMTDVEYLCEALQSADLRVLNEQLSQNGRDINEGKNLLLKHVATVKAKVQQERDQTGKTSKSTGSGGRDSNSTKNWAADDIQLLIKAVNLFPAGTSRRWDVVAEYLNQHSTVNQNRIAKEVLNKAKELQNSDQQMKDAAKKNAFQAMEKNSSANSACNESKPSLRLESPQEMLGVNLTPWSADEQRLLEQALKTYPASTGDRWDRIADCVPNRSKKDCMKRYKELVEMVKAKKAAQAAASSKK
ncbi:DnaJ-like protein subfamily C member 2 [Armadillidium nasatum]|uniref:DnaJ-like protein subfamily C member 2 n=1 Tax=Armadillidium nasatum TaxID=96803 RepID=A0A5N5TC88_9CRUS|nr:DnaJ-like protein subfamily C member 2 [Armadillidium nasatum]